jgi:hypothetical protein
MTPDSLVSNPWGAQGLNRYSYVENGPLSAVDPSGHFCGPSPGGAGGGCNEDMTFVPPDSDGSAIGGLPDPAPYACYGLCSDPARAASGANDSLDCIYAAGGSGGSPFKKVTSSSFNMAHSIVQGRMPAVPIAHAAGGTLPQRSIGTPLPDGNNLRRC